MTEPFFTYEDDPAEPGWKLWAFRDPTRFNASLGPMHVKMEDGLARVRITPGRGHSNMRGVLHGGALLGFMDVALFGAARGFGVMGAGGAVTLDLSAQFIAAGRVGEPLEARLELLRETGRLIFLRGLVVQEGGHTVASFTGTVRKIG